MTEVTKHMVTLDEMVTLILQNKGIHEGYWVPTIEFGFNAGLTGPTPEEAMPSAIVGIHKIGIGKGDASTPLAVDASKANPKMKPEAKKRAATKPKKA